MHMKVIDFLHFIVLYLPVYVGWNVWLYKARAMYIPSASGFVATCMNLEVSMLNEYTYFSYKSVKNSMFCNK